ncbi:MAG: NapC/NirT family cytochrome c [Ignavibacteria bacterium]|nr:NapC/NirT family cytochrome c [Ignavibacteria bacterium]
MKKFFLLLFLLTHLLLFSQTKPGDFKYDDFKTPEYCGTSCHVDIYQQWRQAMMSEAFTHEWDEIEYFDLALPHSEKDENVAEVKAGCNACHAPLAYVTGDIPPKRPKFNTRANESVSCEVCHSIVGYSGDIPYNGNYIMRAGKTKFSSRKSDVESPVHIIEKNDLFKSGDFCGICHNEKSPFGVWVKSTHLEWKEGPYSKEGVQCQDCHMPKVEMRTASMSKVYPDARSHLFHGAHDKGKLSGVIELRIQPDIREVEPGQTVKFSVILFNAKAGHKFPTGSVEDRLVWLEVNAFDSKGNKYHLPVDKKGFEGEDYTISQTGILAYQDLGIAKGITNFKGLERDAIPSGNRIFRKAYLDPQGRLTIQQWNTASFGVDYRIGPREAVLETFTFRVPENCPPGKMKITATLNYQLLVKSVGEFLGVPPSEYETIKINEHSTEITILD